VHLND
jgi:hypothetical protein